MRMIETARDYDTMCKTFRWRRPERYNFARDVVDRWALEDPHHRALHWVDETGAQTILTFADVARRSRCLCNLLTAAGVSRGEVVIVVLGRVPAWWEALTACLRMGAVFSPGTLQLSSRDLAYRITSANAVCVITDDERAVLVDEIADSCPNLRTRIVVGRTRAGWIDYESGMGAASEDYQTAATAADEPAICFFTSGTTGYPKQCIHSHSYAIGHEITGYWLGLGKKDLHWNISDTGWAKAAWSSYFGPWNRGATVFVDGMPGFSAKRTLKLLQDHPITTMCGAPTVYRMLVQEDLQRCSFPALRHCVGAGEPLNPEVIGTWQRETGIAIHDGYGQTETTLLCGMFPGLPLRPGSMGKPAPGVHLAVIDEAGQPVVPGAEGDIAVRVEPISPQGMFQTYRTIPGPAAHHVRKGWYVTGDRGRIDEDGYFWFVSRADDVIVSSGYRIGPFEVESALVEHPAVVESAVVSSPDETRGSVVKAFIVLAPGHRPSDELRRAIQEHVKRVTAPYKYPRRIEFVEELPKTISGKIRRVELRRKEWESADTTAAQEPQSLN